MAQVVVARQQREHGQQLPLGPLFHVFEEVRQLRRAMHAQRTAHDMRQIQHCVAMPSSNVWTARAQELTRRLVAFFRLVGLLWGLLVGVLGLPVVRCT